MKELEASVRKDIDAAVELAKKYNQPTQVGRRNSIFFENAAGFFNRFVRSPVKCLL